MNDRTIIKKLNERRLAFMVMFVVLSLLSSVMVINAPLNVCLLYTSDAADE